MCGIVGIWSNKQVSEEEIVKVTQTLNHRGPDAHAVYISPDRNIAFGHTRLSVIDLSFEANQPFVRNGFVIVFNGEIYNYRTIRNDLINEGVYFTTESDTEVLLAAYEMWGQRMLTNLEGMFAFAIYNTADNKIFLARDRIGKKPLYYYYFDGLFIFASEPKAILAHPTCKANIDYDALGIFLHLGYIPEPVTAWKNIHRLPAAGWVEFSIPDKLDIKRYWDIGDAPSNNEFSDRNALNQFHSILFNAVTKRLHSDVPLGALLSGGTDSSLVCALANEQLTGKLKTFHIGFEEQEYNESHYAEKVARVLGTEHHTFVLSIKEAIRYVEIYLNHFDEPFADTSAIPTLMVSELTRKQVTVALTGDGGDELFLGYGTYRWADRLKTWERLGSPFSTLLQALPAPLNKAGEMLATAGTDQRSHIFSVEQGFFTLFELSRLVRQPLATFSFSDKPFKKIYTAAERQAFFDLNYYLKDDLLVKVDRASMRYALECRCPLMDHELVEFALTLPAHYKMRGRIQKYLPKKLLRTYLPDELVHRTKQGFSIPLASWLRADLRYLVDTYLSQEVIKKFAFVDTQQVRLLVSRFLNGEEKLYHRVWALIVLHRWLQTHAK